MALKDYINKGVCGAGETMGFNTSKGCSIPFKEVDELWLTPANFEFDGSEDLTEDYIKSVQKAGNLTILKNVVSSESQGTESQFSTNAKGFKEEQIDGIYEYKYIFNEDKFFNKLLGTLTGKKNKRVYKISKKTIYGTKGSTEGSIKGFLGYSISRPLQKEAQGTEVAEQYLQIQYDDRAEFDDYPVLLSPDVTGLNTNDIEPIVQTYLSFYAVPTSGATEIAISAVVDRGRKGHISGLTNAKGFNVTINGTLNTLTGVETSTPSGDGYYYAITLPAATATGDVINVSLGGVQEVVGDCLYTSNTVTKTTIAGA